MDSGLVLKTPIFMPVATKLSVKTVSPADLIDCGTSALITNGFLAHLRPGSETLKEMGGIGPFMGWEGGLFSDSGGFQIIRKGFDPRFSDSGVMLRSPYSGSVVELTPEKVVDIHHMHGVDVGMVLDHCPPYGSSEEGILTSARRTLEWARRSCDHVRDISVDLLPKGRIAPPMIFAITQGGTFTDIREKNTKKLIELDLPGYGIGGLSIGEDKSDTFSSLRASTSFLPVDKPRYFMGVGDPKDVVRSVASGVDIFDSVFPTRNARHGSVFTPSGRENIRASSWRGVSDPILEGCGCPACRDHTRGYIEHLFSTGELLGARLATVHNLHFMQQLVTGIRRAILEGENVGQDIGSEIMSFFE